MEQQLLSPTLHDVTEACYLSTGLSTLSTLSHSATVRSFYPKSDWLQDLDMLIARSQFFTRCKSYRKIYLGELGDQISMGCLSHQGGSDTETKDGYRANNHTISCCHPDTTYRWSEPTYDGKNNMKE